MQQLSICLAALPCFSDLSKPLFYCLHQMKFGPCASSLLLFLRDSSSSLAADHSEFHTCYSHLWLRIQNSSFVLHTTKTLVCFCSFHFHSCFSFVFCPNLLHFSFCIFLIFPHFCSHHLALVFLFLFFSPLLSSFVQIICV